KTPPWNEPWHAGSEATTRTVPAWPCPTASHSGSALTQPMNVAASTTSNRPGSASQGLRGHGARSARAEVRDGREAGGRVRNAGRPGANAGRPGTDAARRDGPGPGARPTGGEIATAGTAAVTAAGSGGGEADGSKASVGGGTGKGRSIGGAGRSERGG